MKKTIIKAVYLLIVFVVSFLVIGSLVNQGNADMTMEMGPSTFPVIRMNVGGHEINSLHGYKNSMKISSQRDSITPLEDGRKVDMTVYKYGQSIEGLSFEVRSMDGERLVESTEITDYQETEDDIKAVFAIKDLIEEDTEYMLVLMVRMGNGQTVRYYTRIIQTENYHTAEKIEYVLDFHRRIFNKEEAKELTKYLESNSTGDNTTYSKVTINSSFQQVTWGDLAVKKITKPHVTIKELASQTGSLEADYIVSIGEGAQQSLFHIKEFYRIRYTADRIYLLDYERTMRQIFDEKAEIYVNNKIYLGIVSDEDIVLCESDGGNVFAFTDGSRLYSYNLTDNKISLLFSFYDGNFEDERVTWQKHKIEIMNVDEAGNVEFIVYGYMNRGKHEGETGIAVYRFSGLLNTVEELAYIPSDSSYEILKAEIGQLSYINRSGIFFFMQNGSIYAVNLDNRTSELMVSDLKEGSYKVSDSNKTVVWQDGGNPYECEKLILMNLNSKKITEIKAGADEYISPLGFMQEDLVYGLAKTEDVVKNSAGNILFPMYIVNIQSESGSILKTYSQENIYVIGGRIENNQINMYRLQREEGSGEYTEISDYQIVDTKIESTGSNILETAATEQYENVVQIAVKSNIDTKSLKMLTPKEVLFEGGREISLKESGTDSPKYYVYGKYGVEGIFTDEGNAVNLAYDLSGNVINEKGHYVWKRGNRSLKNQIMAIKGEGIDEGKTSLSVCLDAILQFEGIMRNTEYLLSKGDTIPDILEDNLEDVRVLDLSGCSLDAILYYTNMDIPVIATLNDGNAVLIVGFNELNMVLMDPLTGTVYKKGMNDSKQMFDENGNRFITYMREE